MAPHVSRYQVEQETAGPEHQRQEKHGRHDPCGDATPTAVEIDPAPDEEVESEKVQPGDGYPDRRTEERGDARKFRARDNPPDFCKTWDDQRGVERGRGGAYQRRTHQPFSHAP